MKLYKHHLFWPLLLLSIASLVFDALWWIVANDRISGLFGNLGAGFFGTVVTVLFVDRVIELHQGRERRHYRDVALATLGPPLRGHFHHLAEMLKVSVRQAPVSMPPTLKTFLDGSYVEAVANLDFSQPFSDGVVWADYSCNQFRHFKGALTQVLDKYAVFLEADLVALIESLLASPTLNIATTHFPTLIRLPGVSPALLSHESVTKELLQYCAWFTGLAEQYNAIATEDRLKVVPSTEVWRTDVMPAIGAAMMRSR